MKIEIRALDSLNREIVTGWSNSELGAEDELARIIDRYKEEVCPICDGNEEVDFGEGNVEKCECQKIPKEDLEDDDSSEGQDLAELEIEK